MTRLVIILAAFVLLCRSARADEPIRLRSAASCHTTAGSEVTLPPGVFLPEPAWLALDAEVRRLQESGTRLEAENASLRASLDKSGWGFTLAWVGAALLVGALGGGAVVAAYR